jgi:hypothetical protein
MRTVWLSIAALLATAGGLPAGDAPLDRATLRGLKAVNIVLDRLDPELERAGVTAAAVSARLHEQLARAGIKTDPGAVEFLGMRVLQVRGGRGPYAVSLALGLYQPVLLVRDHNVKTATPTWGVETVLMADPKQVKEAALASVDELAASFAAAWRAVNP